MNGYFTTISMKVVLEHVENFKISNETHMRKLEISK